METFELHLRKSSCVQTVGEGTNPGRGNSLCEDSEPGRAGPEHTVSKPEVASFAFHLLYVGRQVSTHGWAVPQPGNEASH